MLVVLASDLLHLDKQLSLRLAISAEEPRLHNVKEFGVLIAANLPWYSPVTHGDDSHLVESSVLDEALDGRTRFYANACEDLDMRVLTPKLCLMGWWSVSTPPALQWSRGEGTPHPTGQTLAG